MAYLHCHSCNWSQDDFYSKYYNPLTKIIGDIKWLWKPKLIEFDSMFVKIDMVNLKKYTHVPVMCCNNKVFSWNWLIFEIVNDIKIAFKQKWWTYKSWKKDYDNGAVCPRCGERNFDID